MIRGKQSSAILRYMSPSRNRPDRSTTLDDLRLVADLRIMHAKVDELHQIVQNLKRRHSSSQVHRFADHSVLAENITRVDEIYLWFIRLKEEAERLRNNRKQA